MKRASQDMQSSGLLWVIEVEWKRLKDRPVEVVAMTTGGLINALSLAKSYAEKLNVPQSWVNPVFYRRARGQGPK